MSPSEGRRDCHEAASAADAIKILDRYRRTILHFAGGLSIDLRVPLDPSSLDALAGLGFDRPFAVLTAHNPGKTLSDDANARRHAGVPVVRPDTAPGTSTPIPITCCVTAAHRTLDAARFLQRAPAVRPARGGTVGADLNPQLEGAPTRRGHLLLKRGRTAPGALPPFRPVASCGPPPALPAGESQ